MDPNDTIIPPDDTDDPIAAMDKGIAEATEAADPVVVEPVTVEPVEAEPVAVEPVPGTAEALAAKAAADQAEAAAGKPTPDPEVEQEIAERGLQGKSADRFRELANEVKAVAPFKAAMEAAGIKTPEDLQAAFKAVNDHRELVGYIESSGVDGAQFGQTIDYLGLVSKARAGDREAGEAAFKVIEAEYKAAALALGKDVAGVDPLDGFADLQQQVKDLDITRAAALELANRRRADAAREQQSQASRQQGEQTRQQEEARAKGAADLNALDQVLRLDPAFPGKYAMLVAKVREITAAHPPEEWATLARAAYLAIPAPAAVVPPNPGLRKPPVGAVRGNGPRPAMVPEFDDPRAAMDFGVDSAS